MLSLPNKESDKYFYFVDKSETSFKPNKKVVNDEATLKVFIYEQKGLLQLFLQYYNMELNFGVHHPTK